MLRTTLRLDALASGLMGLILAAGAAALDGLLGVPTGWLVAIGVALLGWAAALLRLAARPVIPAAATRTVIAVNAAWVLASVGALVADWFPFTATGVVMTVAQALAVAALADLQFLGLRRVQRYALAG